MVLLIALLRGYIFEDSAKPRKVPPVDKPEIRKKLPCLLCGSSLIRGERLHTELYSGDERSVVHIFGCPHCYGPRANQKRNCPICKKELKSEGYLLGKMWKKKTGKHHVHVSGCTDCF